MNSSPSLSQNGSRKATRSGDSYAAGSSFETGFNESFCQTTTGDSFTVMIQSEVLKPRLFRWLVFGRPRRVVLFKDEGTVPLAKRQVFKDV